MHYSRVCACTSGAGKLSGRLRPWHLCTVQDADLCVVIELKRPEKEQESNPFLNADSVGFIAEPGLYFVQLHSSYYIVARGGPGSAENKKKQTDQHNNTYTTEPSGFSRAGVIRYIRYIIIIWSWAYKYNKRDFTSGRETLKSDCGETVCWRVRVSESGGEGKRVSPVTFSRPLRAWTPMMNRSSF